ncbi:RNA-binding ribosome biosynthesis protein mak21 [Fusarium torreyae]|uniref:RNA-binding ribosome biosynthesis protein mak21 n=1 Tax=Fusarium torreyae TaxID=1237075 RepID=A0A9W8SHJ1_9HYPO|nr:RNA-binding ribosome biosynthesis protein mak21 [Fusarium torreyae]
MAKPSKKGKGPRRSQDGPGLDNNALDNLTSTIDKKLGKRKQPPTKSARDQHQKRQRNSDGPSGDKKSDKIDEKTLLEEIKALGGDESDLALIQGIDSDDEDYAQGSKDSKSVDKSLKDELAAFSKQLGFAEVEMSEASDQDEDEEEDDDEEDAEEEDESEDEVEAPKETAPKKGNMAFEPRADWHAGELRKLPAPTTDEPSPSRGALDALKQHAQTLLEEDATKYRTSVFAQSSHKFLSTIMSSGTLNDKVSALTLAVQESPVHNIRAFDALMSLASKKSRGQALGAIGALVDLLGPGTLLPADRRLRAFHAQPGLIGTLQRNPGKPWAPGNALPGKITPAHLIAWAYEDWLKETYFRLIQLLESWCSDEIEYSRTRALDFVYGLLKEKPEQESNLLRLLVNKLGDRDRKISSRASFLLLQLQNSHPGMKPIIVRTIEQEILLHPSQDHRSKYYAINTLNQTILSNKEPALAESLMRIYFELFTIILKTGTLGIAAPTDSKSAKDDDRKKEDDQRKAGRRPQRPRGGKPTKPVASEPETEAADKLVSAILTGVNRAAPFMVGNEAIMESHLDTLFKIAHSANFNTGIQALLLIQQISSSRALANDRFYRTLYESLLDPRLVNSSKQALYLNLLLRALKNDVDSRRVKAFAKRMLQMSGLHQPAFACGLLYVVGHLRETFPDLSTLLEEPEESIFDDEPANEKHKYDGRKRDPEYSNANRSCLWEVIPLQGHYHPSVTVYAASIVERNKKAQKPDLDSHSLIRFLDKFVYRNAKATDSSKGVSIMQPLRAAKDVGDIWLGSRGAGAATTSVNSASFWKKKTEDVAAEDVFFHEYFQQVDKEGKETKKKAQAGANAESDDEQEDEVWKALVSTQPGVDPDDEGSDVGFDLDDSDMASDDDSPAMSLDGELGEEDDDDMSVDIEGSDEEMGGAMISEDEEGFEVKEAASEKPKSKRRKLKDLPMFASVDDYAELLAGEEDM